MYNDYDEAKLMYDQRLREAEQHRQHNQLVDAALEYAAEEKDGQSLNFIQRLIRSRNQPRRENKDTRRVHAV